MVDQGGGEKHSALALKFFTQGKHCDLSLCLSFSLSLSVFLSLSLFHSFYLSLSTSFILICPFACSTALYLSLSHFVDYFFLNFISSYVPLAFFLCNCSTTSLLFLSNEVISLSPQPLIIISCLFSLYFFLMMKLPLSLSL